MPRLRFYDDPGEFLDVAGELLAVDPVLNTVLATIAQRARADRRAGIVSGRDDWYLAVQDERRAVVGLAMRTAPFPPRPLYLLPMPDDAAVALARALHDRAEPVGAANGARPATSVFAEESARLGGGTVRVAQHTRLFELRSVTAPRPVTGRLRPAERTDLDLVLRWFGAFHHDAAAQAGRQTGSADGTATEPQVISRRIDTGLIWLWTDQDDRVVHLTGTSDPSFGVQRIGPVYTSPEHRGHGFASAAVAEVSGRILANGHRPCLFTDQANPVSNAIYQAIGYRAVVDMINLVIV